MFKKENISSVLCALITGLFILIMFILVDEFKNSMMQDTTPVKVVEPNWDYSTECDRD